jgi:osmotically-inducible protein OsmY
VEKDFRVSTWSFLVKKALPAIPDALSGVEKNLDKRKFGKALSDVEHKLPRLEGDELAAGEKIRDWIKERATSRMEKAASYVEDGKIYKGFLLYQQVEDDFKGNDLSKEAKEAARALEKDKEKALEIKASEKLDAIKKDMAGERDAEDKLKCLKPLLSRKYEDTMAGKEAAELAKELEEKAS